MNNQEAQKKSGFLFFAELLIGGALGFSILSYVEISAHQLNEFQKLANAVSFLLLTIGAVFRKQPNCFMEKTGNMIMSLGIILIGAGTALMVEVYTRS